MSTKIITSKNFNSNILQFLPSNIDEQFHIGMKILLCSYENKVKEYEKVISDLNEKINNLDDTINKQKYDCSKFTEDINKLVNENNYLLNLNKNLSNTVKQLENFKNSILGSIEKESFEKKEEPISNSFMNKMVHNIPKTINFSTTNTHTVLDQTYFKPQITYDKQDTIEELLNSKFEKLKTLDTNHSNNSSMMEQGRNDKNSIESKIKQFRGKLRNNINRSNNFNNHQTLNTEPIFTRNYKDLEDNNFKNSSNKSDQYILSSKFFGECRTVLQKEENMKLLETLKKSNSNEISKEEAFEIIKEILVNYPKILNDFQMIFQ